MVNSYRAVRQLERALGDNAVRRGSRSEPPIPPGEGAILIATIVYGPDGTERIERNYDSDGKARI